MADFVPYGKLDATIIQCIAESAQKHQAPEALLHALIKKEGGTTGKCVTNTNGSLDCGLAQINTVWAPEFKKYNVSYQHVANDACLNVDAQGFIIRTMYNQKKNWTDAIIAYNIGPSNWTPKRYSIGVAYATDVIKYWHYFEKYRGTGRPPEVPQSRTMPVTVSSYQANSQNTSAVAQIAPIKKDPLKRSSPKAPFVFSIEDPES